MRKLALLALLASPVWGGASLVFDGVNDSVDLQGQDVFDGATEFSVSVWVAQSTTAEHYVLHDGESGTDRFSLRTHWGDTNDLEFFIRTNSAGNCGLITTGVDLPADGSWHHIMCRWSANGGSGLIDCFVDGSQASESSTYGTCADSAMSSAQTGDVCIAARNRQSGGSCQASQIDKEFTGNIAHLAIYTTFLTATENSQEMYCSGTVTRNRQTYVPLMDDGSTQYDLSGNDMDGTNYNNAAASASGPPIGLCGGIP